MSNNYFLCLEHDVYEELHQHTRVQLHERLQTEVGHLLKNRVIQLSVNPHLRGLGTVILTALNSPFSKSSYVCIKIVKQFEFLFQCIVFQHML